MECQNLNAACVDVSSYLHPTILTRNIYHIYTCSYFEVFFQLATLWSCLVDRQGFVSNSRTVCGRPGLDEVHRTRILILSLCVGRCLQFDASQCKFSHFTRRQEWIHRHDFGKAVRFELLQLSFAKCWTVHKQIYLVLWWFLRQWDVWIKQEPL